MLAPIPPVAFAAIGAGAATFRPSRRRPRVLLAAVASTAFLRAAFGLFRERRLPGGLAHFLLQPHGAARRIEYFEQPVVLRARVRIARRVAVLFPDERCRFQDGLALPSLKRVDTKDAGISLEFLHAHKFRENEKCSSSFSD